MTTGLKKSSWPGKILSIILLLIILVTVGVLCYVVAVPFKEKPYTEFYILGTNGKATDYPVNLRVGEEAKVIIGIVNHENKSMSYWVEVRIDGVTKKKIDPVLLANVQKWEETVSFTPDKARNSQKVEFMLFKGNDAEPSLDPLNLWINVSSR